MLRASTPTARAVAVTLLLRASMVSTLIDQYEQDQTRCSAAYLIASPEPRSRVAPTNGVKRGRFGSQIGV